MCIVAVDLVVAVMGLGITTGHQVLVAVGFRTGTEHYVLGSIRDSGFTYHVIIVDEFCVRLHIGPFYLDILDDVSVRIAVKGTVFI